MQLWAIYAIIGGIFSNLQAFSMRRALKEGEDSTSVGWYFELFRFLGALILIQFNYKLIISAPSIICFMILGLVEFVAIYLYTKMHSLNELSISSLVSRLRLIWIPILAFIFFNETLTYFEYLGVIIIFLGLSVLTSFKKILIDKGLRISFLFAFFSACLGISIKAALNYASSPVVLAIMAIFPLFMLPVFMKQGGSRIKRGYDKKVVHKVATVIFDLFALIAYMTAIGYGQIGKVAALYQSMMVLSVLAGIFILKERKNIAKKLLGTTIVIIGILLLYY